MKLFWFLTLVPFTIYAVAGADTDPQDARSSLRGGILERPASAGVETDIEHQHNIMELVELGIDLQDMEEDAKLSVESEAMLKTTSFAVAEVDSTDNSRKRELDSKQEAANTNKMDKLIDKEEESKANHNQIHRFLSDIKSTLHVFPTADSYIRGGYYKHRKYGDKNTLMVKNDHNPSYIRKSLIRFDISSLNGNDSNQIYLNLYVESTGTLSSRTVSITRGIWDPDWEEDTVTYDNFIYEPYGSGPTSVKSFTVTPSDSGSWIRIGINEFNPGLFRDDGTLWKNELLLELKVSSSPHSQSHVNFGSRESEHAPYILIKYDAPNDFTAIQDSYIRGGDYKHKSYGHKNTLMVKNDHNPSYIRKSLIRFDISSLHGWNNLFLDLYVESTGTLSSRTVSITQMWDPDWEEDTVTYDNFIYEPYGSGPTSVKSFTVTPSDSGSWIRIGINEFNAGLVRDDGTLWKNELLLELKVSSSPHSQSHVNFGSRESEHAPHIYVLN